MGQVSSANKTTNRPDIRPLHALCHLMIGMWVQHKGERIDNTFVYFTRGDQRAGKLPFLMDYFYSN